MEGYVKLSQEAFHRLFSRNEWMQFPFRFLQFIPIDEAVLLAYLLGKSRALGAYKKKRKGWFYLHSAKIMRVFRVSEFTQTRLIKNLTRRGFIKIKREGIPCRRWMKIDLTQLENPVPEPTRDLQSRPTKGHNISNILKDSKREAPTGNFEFWCCELLRNAIHTKTNRITRWRNVNQTKFIRTLVNSVKDKDTFLTVLEWYCDNLNRTKQLKLPNCYSPEELARPKLWSWILDKWEKNAPKEQEVLVTAIAKVVFERVKGLHWPKGSVEQLPKLIQLSMDAYCELRSRLKKYLDKCDDPMSDQRYWWCVDHINKKLQQPASFTENWFRELNKQVQSWDNWHGDLFDHRFQPTHKRFIAKGREIVRLYGGRVKFEDLVKTLYAKD